MTNSWSAPRSDAERQPPGGEYGDDRPVGLVEVWREGDGFAWRVTKRTVGHGGVITEETLPPGRDDFLPLVLWAVNAATGTTGVAWNYDALRAASSWDALPSGHIGQLGHAETDRLFDVVWVRV